MSLPEKLRLLADRVEEMWVCNERLTLKDYQYKILNELAVKSDIYLEHLDAAVSKEDKHIFVLMEHRLNRLYDTWNQYIKKLLN